MKILVLGNSNNIWLARYVKYVLYDHFSEIYVSQNSEIIPEFMKEYEECNVNLINTSNKITIFGRISVKLEIIRLIRTLLIIRKLKDIDIIHLHFVSRTFLLALKFAHNSKRKIIATFWGSDLLRHDKVYFKRYRNILSKFNYITVSSEEMRRDLLNKLPPIDPTKIRIVKFGISTLKAIDIIKKTKSSEACKASFGIKENRYVIAVGYNRSKTQNHINVIQALGKIQEKKKEKITILLQLTYGPSDEEYYSSLRKSLAENGLEYIMLFDYLDETQSAILRLAVDYFINAQDTDAFSATMQEYLYAGAIILNSSRLKYDELENMHSHFFIFNEYTDISTYFNESELRKTIPDNKIKEDISKISSWESTANQWMRLYE